MQSAAKAVEIRIQLNKMVANAVVTPSQADAWSQVLLTPKPNQKWRLCIDYRRLNDSTKSRGWPIPNVKEMLNRVGTKRAKYFGVIDLTSGYHQAPLGTSSRGFTAFMTVMGLFEWLRVPMGLKGAPAYFQQMMITIVLVGIYMAICEVYMDDILVFAKTEDEFITNCRTIFKRLRKHKLTANPTKTRLAMQNAEYVGHVIDEQGLTFSKEKIDSVANFEKPKTAKQLKSFLGLCNYFRDHIRDHSTLVQPLQVLIPNYEKRAARNLEVVWNAEAEQAFATIKEKISDCPTIFFMDDDAPIFLHTDASDYGIGAYLFQIIDGKERPIQIISKTLAKEQLRWSTPEKEAFAIIYALQKMDYLLRDVHFTLRTDHKNLIYINTAGSEKVYRWKIYIQSYDFQIEHIEGEKNVVADCLSRLCPLTEEIEQELCLIHEREHIQDVFTIIETQFIIPRDKYKVISKVHNSLVGHHGVENTMVKLNQGKKSWLYMREHVKRFVKMCPCCQKLREKQLINSTHPFTAASLNPMERLNIDTIGPLPPDENGNEHIIVIIDTFTRFVELYPAKDTTAVVAALALLQHFGTFGCPSQILSDNGTQFVNNLIEEFLKLCDVEHLTTLAYSKEENTIVERANKEVMRHLRAIIFEKKSITDWWKYLPIVKRIINATPVASTGVAPARLLFGESIDLQRNMFVLPSQKNIDGEISVSLSEWAANMLKTQEAILKSAQQVQKKKDDKHMADAAPERTEYPIGSHVLVEYPTTRMSLKTPTKFHTNLKGPLRVIKFDKNDYTLLDLTNNKEEKCHITRLHPFIYDSNEIDPREIAMKDNQYNDIEAILKHKGSIKNKTAMTFLVKWAGYDASHNSWEPWNGPKGTGVRTNAVLHKYLANHNMKNLIPSQFKTA